MLLAAASTLALSSHAVAAQSGPSWTPPPEAIFENITFYWPNASWSGPYLTSSTTGVSGSYSPVVGGSVYGSATIATEPILRMHAWAASSGQPGDLRWVSGDVGVRINYMVFDPAAYDPSCIGGCAPSYTLSIPMDFEFNSRFTGTSSGTGAYTMDGSVTLSGLLNPTSGVVNSYGDTVFGAATHNNTEYGSAMWDAVLGNTLSGPQGLAASVPTNQWESISMRLSAMALADYGGRFAPSGGPGESSVTDFIDPMVQIDPAYHGDPIELIFNAQQAPSGVPEASTWTMMAIGFAGLGFALRARRRRSIPAV